MSDMKHPGSLITVAARTSYHHCKVLRLPQATRGLDMELRLTSASRRPDITQAHITLSTSEQTRDIVTAWGPVDTLLIGDANDFPCIFVGSSCFDLTSDAAAAVRIFLADYKVSQ